MKKLVIQAIEKALNSYLALDPESQTRLSYLNDKIVKVDLLGINLIFYLSFNQTTIKITSNIDTKADTTISGTPLRLLYMTVSRGNRQQFFSDDVAIQGNLEIGQHVIDLFDDLEVDWEEFLSKWIGDAPANFLGRLGRQLKAWGQQAHDTLVMDVNEYVHEEINIFPPLEALQDFFHEVDLTRMDADRLEAKVMQLQKTLAVKRGIS